MANEFLRQLGTGNQIKDFKHASKTFVTDTFRLAPRQGYLYHVFFELNPEITRIGVDQQKEFGMLVKSVDLPKFSIDTKNINSYNHPNIVQTKIKYDNVSIVFHDDHADVTRGLWFDYYNYYYRDADLNYADKSGMPNPAYFQNSKYSKRDANNWGYTPRSQSSLSGVAQDQYIKAIRIYSLAQKRFAEYTLINPKIVSFQHGQHTAGSAEPMQNTMTIAYESVLYASGWVSTETVKGFGEAMHYDKEPSPLTPMGGGTKSIVGPGGLIDMASTAVDSLTQKPANPGAALFTAFRGYQNLKNTNLGAVAKQELSQLGMDILRGNNPLNRLFVPSVGNLSGGAPIYEYGKGVPGGMPNPGGGATSNGDRLTPQASRSLAGVSLPGVGASILSGANAGGLATVGGLVLGAGSLDKLIKIDPKSGAVTGTGQLPSVSAGAARLFGKNNQAALGFQQFDVQFPDDEAQNISTSQVVLDNNTPGLFDDAEAGITNYYENDGTVSTTDITQPTSDITPLSEEETAALFAEAEANASQKNDPFLTNDEVTATGLFAEENNASLNNNLSGVYPTNQGDET